MWQQKPLLQFAPDAFHARESRFGPHHRPERLHRQTEPGSDAQDAAREWQPGFASNQQPWIIEQGPQDGRRARFHEVRETRQKFSAHAPTERAGDVDEDALARLWLGRRSGERVFRVYPHHPAAPEAISRKAAKPIGVNGR